MRRALGLVAAMAVLSGCSVVQYFEPEPRPTAQEGAWNEARQRATRSGKIYDALGTNAFVGAVYQAPDIREARVERLATWAAMTAEERERLLAAEREEAARYDTFLVSLFTPDRGDNDLDSRSSIWRVALVVPGEGEALPESVSIVRVDSTLKALYPNVDRNFAIVYRVRFARWTPPIAGRAFILRLAGAKGRLDLDFGRPPTEEPPPMPQP